jgi:23S rRNA (adenine2030-N6)-methyltransferase
MLSYRHGFHAGNFADVFKHVILSLLVRAQLRKDKPFCYLDTHAGAGRYELGSTMAQKNREFAGGISRLWRLAEVPEAVRVYLEAVQALNPAAELKTYPGSPRIVRHFLRPQDRMVLCELHGKEAEHLQAEFEGDRLVATHHSDGYHGLKAFLPPLEKRGLILIDPAFELKDERARLLESILLAYKRFAGGVYAIWYPIQDRASVDWFHRQLVRSGIRNILAAELRIFDEDQSLRLNGSGMVIINPPWQLDEELKAVGPWLWNVLSPEGRGGFKLDCLVPE